METIAITGTRESVGRNTRLFNNKWIGWTRRRSGQVPSKEGRKAKEINHDEQGRRKIEKLSKRAKKKSEKERFHRTASGRSGRSFL